MRYTYGALKLLAAAYRRILKKCALANNGLLILGLAALPCLALPAHAAAPLNAQAINNVVQIDEDKTGSVLQIEGLTGNRQAQINIAGGTLVLTGEAQDTPFTNAQQNSFHINNGRLQFGEASSSPGGLLSGSIVLNNGELTAIGTGVTVLDMPSTSVGGRSDSQSAVSAQNVSSWALQRIGSMTSPVQALNMTNSTIQLNSGLKINKIDMENSNLFAGSAISADVEDANFNDPAASLIHSTIRADRGNIVLGDVTSPQTGSHQLNMSAVEAVQGNINIHGHVNVAEGLTTLKAGKDIILDNGNVSDQGAGYLHLEAAGNIQANTGDITALEITAGGAVQAGNISAQNFQAQSVNTAGNLSIKNYELKLSGSTQSVLSGNLELNSARLSVKDLAVHGDATIGDTSGSWQNLDVTKSVIMSGSTLAGGTLKAGSLTMGNAPGTLHLDELQLESDLTVADNSTLQASTLLMAKGAIYLQNNSNLLTSDLGSDMQKISSLNIEGGSNAHVENGAFIDNLNLATGQLLTDRGDITVAGGQINLAGGTVESATGNLLFEAPITASNAVSLRAGQSITVQGAVNSTGTLSFNAANDILVTDHLEATSLEAGGIVSASSITTNNISATSVDVSGLLELKDGVFKTSSSQDSQLGSLKLENAVLDLGSINIEGDSEISASSGIFQSINGNQTISIDTSTLKGDTLNAKSLLLNGESGTTGMNVTNLLFSATLELENNSSLEAEKLDTKNGQISLRSNSSLKAGNIASSEAPLTRLSSENSVIQSANGIHVENLSAFDSGISAANGDISIAGPQIRLESGRLEAETGNILLGADLDPTSSSTLIKAGKDIKSAGKLAASQLEIQAGGNIVASGPIEAARVSAGQNVEAAQLVASNLTADRFNITGAIQISNGSVAASSPSHAGSLNMQHTSFSLGDLAVDTNITLANTDGSFSALNSNGAFSLAGGTVNGKSLATGTARIGDLSQTSHLTLDELELGAKLDIGNNGVLDVCSLTGAEAAIEIKAGGILNSGSFGNADAPIRNLELSGGATLNNQQGIYVANFSASDSSVSAVKGDISIAGPQINFDGGSLEAQGGDILLGAASQVSAKALDISASNNITASGGLSGRQSLTISAGNNLAVDGELAALSVAAANLVSAQSIDTGQLKATTANVDRSLNISGGDLELSGLGNASSSAASLAVSDAHMSVGDLVIASQASFSNVNGNFHDLEAATLDFTAVNLTGNRVAGQTISLDGQDSQNSLHLNSLVAARKLILNNSASLALDGALAGEAFLQMDGSSQFTAASAGGADSPLSGASIKGHSILQVEADFFARDLQLENSRLFARNGDINLSGAQNYLSASTLQTDRGSISISGETSAEKGASLISSGKDLNFAGAVRGGPELILLAGENISAKTVTAGKVSAEAELKADSLQAEIVRADRLQISQSLAINNGRLLVAGASGKPSLVNNFLSSKSRLDIARMILAGESNWHGSKANWEQLELDGTLTLAGGSYTGQTLDGGILNVFSDTDATFLNVQQAGGQTLYNIGKGAHVTFGQTNADWLEEKTGQLDGVSGALGIYSPVVFEGGGLNLNPMSGDDFAAENDHELFFAPDSLLVVNGEMARESINPNGVISANRDKKAYVANEAKLYVTGVSSGQTYVILGKNIATAYQGGTAWEGVNLLTDAHMIKLRKIPDRDGSFTTETATAGEIYPDLDGEIGGIVEDNTSSGNLGTEKNHFDSQYAGVRFLSRTGSVQYMDHDYSLAVKTMESASRIAILGAMPQILRSASATLSRASQSRASFADLPFSRLENQEISGGNLSLWALPVFKNMRGHDLHANNYDYDYTANMGGLILGLDWTSATKLRAGISGSVGQAFSHSGGDLARTTNKASFGGIGIYGGWRQKGWAIDAEANYTATHNRVKQDLPANLQMKDFKGDLTARALSMGMNMAYSFDLGALQLMPHAGASFMQLHTDNYSFYSNGAAIDGQNIEQAIWSFPFGLKFSGLYEIADWKIKPYLDLGFTAHAGDIEADTTIRYTGTRRDASLKTQTADYFDFSGQFALEASKENLGIGLQYNLEAGSKTRAQSVFALLRYEF